MNVLAETGWPEAVIAIAGLAFITIVASITVWQIFATGRLGLSARREGKYKEFADELAAAQRETTAELQKANEALAQLRAQTRELEHGLAEVDRLLKTVE